MATKSTTKRSRDVLFLGRSGGGKSTTINTLANICAYYDYKKALEENDPIVLIPFQFDHNYDDKTKDVIRMGGVHMADAGNEQTENPELSCTQSPRIYSFVKDDKAFNFIDMPGFGDTSGAGQDEHHRLQRQEFLRSLTELHAIVVVMNSQENRITPQFKAALNDVLALVPKAAISNLFFIGTHAIHTNFTGGSLVVNLQDYLNDINKDYEKKYNQKLKLSAKENLYFVDYDGFRHLVAKHRSPRYHAMTADRGDATKSMCWNRTREALWTLMGRVIELKGVPTSIIGDIDLARNTIEIVIDVMMEILVEIEDLKTPEKLKELRTQLEQNGHLSPPCTFCRSCKTPSKSGGIFTATPKICHRNCRCYTGVPPKAPGHAGLKDCTIFANGKCKVCKCPISCHFHDNDTSASHDQDAKAQEILSNYNKKINFESKQIVNVVTMAAAFLKEHTIVAFSNSHQTRLKEEIIKYDNNGDLDLADERREVLEKYQQRIAEVENILERTPNKGTNAEEFKKSLEKLFQLPVTGGLIKDLYNDRTRQQFNFEEPCVYKAKNFPNWDVPF
uniref:G domain-containing protein n=1 Tax=Panagrellus redivivus TaxID=6233 RepID=A0A7E4V1L9_PANRE